MAAIVQFYQTYGPGGGTDVPQGLGAGSNDWDFKSIDSPGPITDPVTQAITAGENSMDVYIRVRFDQPSDGSPAFSSITNVKFYASYLNISGCGGDAVLVASGTDTYSAPTTATKGWAEIPITANAGIDISTDGLAAGTAGFTDWVALQLQTALSGAIAGYAPYSNFTIVYDEV